jgi:hypothetical protein
MLRFLSDEWACRARILLKEARGGSDLGFRIRHVVSGLGAECSLLHEVEKGELVGWELDAPGDPDLEIHWPEQHALAFFRGAADAETLHREVGIREPRRDGVRTSPPPPLDFLARPEIDALPWIPNADLVMQYLLRDGPFGDVACWLRFENGRLEVLDVGACVAPDTNIETTFTAMVRMRCGEITPLQAIAGGRVIGGWEKLTLLSGLMECPEFQSAGRACDARSSHALAALGRYWAAPAVRAALDALAVETAGAAEGSPA